MSLKGSEWELVFRHLPAPCVVLDHDMRIVTASDAYLNAVQRPLDTIVGMYVFDAFPEEPQRLDMIHAAFRKALDGIENSLFEVPFAIPVVDDAGEPTGDTREIWWTCHQKPVFSEDGSVKYMIQNAQDVTKQVQTEKLKNAIAQELQHRVGNILTLVGAVVKRTAANAEDIDDFLAKFDGRIAALSRTHKYLTGDNWDAMTIEKIVTRELEQFLTLNEHQVVLGGGDIALNAAEAQILTLAVHELMTNSVKHGALKSAAGKLDVAWRRIGREGFQFDWQESDVTPAADPDRKGFGSFILDQIIPAQLQAEKLRGFSENAYRYSLTVPERTLSEQADRRSA
jgi:two-component sensor histidine kinase